MGNEISTVGGAIATAATSVAAGVTFGQVDALNNAVVNCAKFTGNAAANTTVRHAGEAVGVAVGTAGVAVAAGVTFGQVDALNNTVVQLAKQTGTTTVKAGKSAVSEVNDLADAIPVVGHVKGGIHYVLGDKEGGDKAMKGASRTTGVITGGVIGIPGGPVGMVAGGIAGGAAMDGIITGADSYIQGEYRPNGVIKSWTDVAKGKDAQTVIGGVVGGLVTPVFDGLVGFKAGQLKIRSRNRNPALDAFMAEEIKGGKKVTLGELSESSWKSAVSEATSKGSKISEFAKAKGVDLYRGINHGKKNEYRSPYKYGFGGEQLGPGLYFTDDINTAEVYAQGIDNTPGAIYKFHFRPQDWGMGKYKYCSGKEGGPVGVSLKQKRGEWAYQIIKTKYYDGNQYRFSPEFVKILEEAGILEKVKDVAPN